MKTPTEFQIQQLMHFYDPKKAHEYYVRTRELKGRKSGRGDKSSTEKSRGPQTITGVSRKKIHSNAVARQRKELSAAIQGMEERLHKLETVIKKRIHEENSDNRKSKAKKERAAKEKDKPKTAAEKAAADRESKQYRDKHKQKLRSKAKSESSKSGGSSSRKSSSGSKHSVDELQILATRVRGQLQVAKQKLAAL